jgi:hypothetical protein
MDYYNYTVDLPYSKCKVKYREINTGEQLSLTKANMSFPNNKESLYDYYQYLLNVVLNCVENKDDFLKINIVDYVLFLVKLRNISIGSTIDFVLKGEEGEKTKKKIQIDLKKYMLNLYNAAKVFESEENNLIAENDLEVKINWPNINSVEVFNDLFLNHDNEYELFNDTICEYVEYIKINNDKIVWNNLNRDQKVKLFDKLPLTIKTKIQNKIILASTELFGYDIFQISFFSDYKFNFYNLSFIEHIKLIFSYDLKSLYQEIYYLSTQHLPPSYIMTISQGERKIYMTIIEEANKKQEKETPDLPEDEMANGSGYSNAIKKLAVEFGEDLSK